MTGDTHYDLEILAELAEGVLDDAVAADVRRHLALCDACGESLADLAAVREMLAAVPVPAMPLGVTMRIDRALAELAPPSPAPSLVPSLGVVREDGTVAVPERRRRRLGWLVPAASVAAAAAVVGVAGLLTNFVASPVGIVAEPQVSTVTPDRSPQRAAAYTVRASGHNYTSRELDGPLLGYFGPEPGTGSNSDEQLDACVQAKSNELDRAPIAVDRALYNGNEATIMAFWEDRSLNRVRVVVVDDECGELRPDGLATWN